MQEALDAMTKEKARLRADMEFLQRQLDLVAQQAEQAAAARSPVKPTKVRHLPELSATLKYPTLIHIQTSIIQN